MKRPPKIALVACTVSVVVGAIAFWLADRRIEVSSPDLSQQVRGMHVVAQRGVQDETVPSVFNRARLLATQPSLMQSPAQGVVTLEQKSPLAKSAPQISRIQIPQPLELDLPEKLGDERATTSDSSSESHQTTASTFASDINPHIDDRDRDSRDDGLFNAYSGLRGFMAKSWVNKSIGIQGGMAIPERQLRETNDSDLRDQMAVGMGVLYAF